MGRVANRYWPSQYLIDAQGYIRYQHAGEGAYDQVEAALAGLAAEVAGLCDAPQTAQVARPLWALRGEDLPGAVCFRTTPELHTGYNRRALGNPEDYLPWSLPLIYQPPPEAERHDGNL